MRFSIIFSALAAVYLVAADGAAIVSALESITESATALNSSVTAFDGDLLKALGIASQASDLLDKIKNGTAVVNEGANLTLAETIALLTPTNSLVSTVQSTLANIRAKKPVFDKDVVVSPIILYNLKEEQSASADLSSAIVAKVPENLQATANSLVAPIQPAFAETIALYQQFSLLKRSEGDFEMKKNVFVEKKWMA